MRLVNLNLWSGKIHEDLLEFVKNKEKKTDIFTFQEVTSSDRNIKSHDVWTNLLGELKNLLADFNFNYDYIGEGYDTWGKVDFPLKVGQATFVRKTIKNLHQGSIFFYRKQGDMGPAYPDGRGNFPRNFLFNELEKDGKKFLVINLHGFWEPAPKYDTPQRFTQSVKILEFISKHKLPTILAGDFNLSLDTRSILLFEDTLSNLVKQYGLKTTRSNLYNPYYRVTDPFADYIFTSKEIAVLDFKALDDEVSDHLPLSLEFEVQAVPTR